jgi:transmembrane sensor
MKKNNKKILLILEELEGRISPSEEKKLRAWLDADPGNLKEYNRIAKIVREGQRLEFPADPDIHEEWNDFNFPADPIPERNRLFKIKPSPWKIIAPLLKPRRLLYAAMILFLIGASVLWYYQSMHIIKTISTVNRQHKQITLSDGTTVYLNSGTQLSYPKTFSGSIRKVTLSGEAFFNVSKAKSEFVVKTPEGTITVLGTRFNIWTRNQLTRVIVEEGCVKLASDNKQDTVIITKDFMSEVRQNHSPLKPRSVDVQKLLGWRWGKLVFKRTTLHEVIGEISRYYDVDISIQGPQLQSRTITAVFDRLPLNKVLYSVCSSLNIQYRYNNGVYVLYK